MEERNIMEIKVNIDGEQILNESISLEDKIDEDLILFLRAIADESELHNSKFFPNK